MLNNIGTVEIIIIAVVVMVLFGSKKLPEFTRSIGEASKEYRKGVKGDDDIPTKKVKLKESDKAKSASGGTKSKKKKA